MLLRFSREFLRTYLLYTYHGANDYHEIVAVKTNIS